MYTYERQPEIEACVPFDSTKELVHLSDARKNAYRYLLYRAMLSIRQITWIEWTWNPFEFRKRMLRLQCAGDIADWLHNLAFFSASDFRGFDESWFWRDFDRLESRYRGFSLEQYRIDFERRA